jgi:GNAT superfamily N-acetyltransferase
MDDAIALIEAQQGNYTISTDPTKLDFNAMHAFLSRAYWSENIPRDILSCALQHSLNFGVYHGKQQIGLARVITDYATFGYVCDVYILEAYRGQGLSKWLMQTVVAHPDLQGFRRWMLATRDAHGLYRQVGFTELTQVERWMEIRKPNTYQPT